MFLKVALHRETIAAHIAAVGGSHGRFFLFFGTFEVETRDGTFEIFIVHRLLLEENLFGMSFAEQIGHFGLDAFTLQLQLVELLQGDEALETNRRTSFHPSGERRAGERF